MQVVPKWQDQGRPANDFARRGAAANDAGLFTLIWRCAKVKRSMKLLDLTIETLAANLALDEALLESAEAETAELPANQRDSKPGPEWLRFWEADQFAVVAGRSSKVATEVHVDYCQRHQIPIFRRSSGGAAVVAGPGCLMYALVLDVGSRPGIGLIDRAHELVMNRAVAALGELGIDVRHQGTCDLTWQGRKFSGNSLRCKRTHVLYHGTFLYDFQLEEIQRCLQLPPRQPDYRRDRSHQEFVTNLPVKPADIKQALIRQWKAYASTDDWPRQRVDELVRTKYSQQDWIHQR